MKNAFKKVEAVAVFKTRDRLLMAVSVFKCDAVLLEVPVGRANKRKAEDDLEHPSKRRKISSSAEK